MLSGVLGQVTAMFVSLKVEVVKCVLLVHCIYDYLLKSYKQTELVGTTSRVCAVTSTTPGSNISCGCSNVVICAIGAQGLPFDLMQTYKVQYC